MSWRDFSLLRVTAREKASLVGNSRAPRLLRKIGPLASGRYAGVTGEWGRDRCSSLDWTDIVSFSFYPDRDSRATESR